MAYNSRVRELNEIDIKIIKESSSNLSYNQLSVKVGIEVTTLKRLLVKNKIEFISTHDLRRNKIQAPGRKNAPMTKLWGVDDESGKQIELLTDDYVKEHTFYAY